MVDCQGTGGLRQFRVLLRKNVMLKTRRPIGTAFELLLPLVLFALLAYVRFVYPTNSKGPFFFSRQSLFPLSATFQGPVGSEATVDLNNGDKIAANKTNLYNSRNSVNRTDLAQFLSFAVASVEQTFVCSSSFTTGLTALSYPILSLRSGNETWAQSLVRAKPEDVGNWTRSTVSSFQSANISDATAYVNSYLQGYLTSGLPQLLAQVAGALGPDLAVLSTGNDTVVRGVADSWSQTLCLLSNPSALSMLQAAPAGQVPPGGLGGPASALPTSTLLDIVTLLRSLQGSSLRLMPLTRSLVGSVDPLVVFAVSYYMANAFKAANVTGITTAADSLFWWMSHYLREGSGAWTILGQGGGQNIPLGDLGLRTEAGALLLLNLLSLQQNVNPLTQAGQAAIAWEVLQTVFLEAGSVIQSVSPAYNASNSTLQDLTFSFDVLNGTSVNVSLTGLPNGSVANITNLANFSSLGNLTSSCASGQFQAQMRLLVQLLSEVLKGTGIYDLSQRSGSTLASVVNMSTVYLASIQPKDISTLLTELQKLVKPLDAKQLGLAATRIVRGVQYRNRGALGQVQAYQVASSLALMTQDAWLRYRGYGSCNSESDLFSLFSLLGGGGLRRLQASVGVPGSWLASYLLSKNLLVVPYKGESQLLLRLAVVEIVTSLLEVGTSVGSVSEYMTGLANPLARCPFVRGMAGEVISGFLGGYSLYANTEADMEKYYWQNPDSVLGAIVFQNTDPVTGNFPPGPLSVEYKIRMMPGILPDTTDIVKFSGDSMFGSGRLSNYPYFDSGFIMLEEALGRASARLRAVREDLAANPGNSQVERNVRATRATAAARRWDVGMEQYPVPKYQVDNYIGIIRQTLPLLMVLGWIYAVSLLVREVVYEKQERLKDVMRIMGLQSSVYWSSWMASAMIQMTVLVLLMVAILKIGNVLKQSSSVIIFVFFWLYSLSSVSFSLLVSSFFSSAKVAAACAGLLYYVTYMPYSLFTRYQDVMPLAGKNAICLLSSTALGVGMDMIGKWELLGQGAQWSNLAQAPPITSTGTMPKQSQSLGHVWFMLILDTILYQALAWYVEKVSPGTLGLPQPWYFPLMKSFWFPGQQTNAESIQIGDEAVEKNDNTILECWEAPPAGLARSVMLRRLAKKFDNGKEALKGISLDMHQGTILGLLGHNGAGKSTTMSILTGLYPPTRGDVFVNGVSVRLDSQGVRRQLGVCLQHNALYENFTVEEHMRLFCCLKGVPWQQLQGEIDGLLRDTGLWPKRSFLSTALSGGMKRKLSIAIALCGGSSVVTLDEPTAGVDATSRRDIWQLLATRKTGRTILLSTHFMDEADILSDRIAIIAEGQLTAIASGMALKRHFADGYLLTVVCTDSSDPLQLSRLILETVPQAKYAGTRGREHSFCLPFDSRSLFSALFERLGCPKERARLGVDTYGLSAASMEEVFLRASSLHETGLHGMVRNADGAMSMAFSDASTSLGASPAASSAMGSLSPDSAAGWPGDGPFGPMSKGVPTPRDDKAALSPLQGTVVGQVADNDLKGNGDASGVVVVGLPVHDRGSAHLEGPRSPQCFTSAEVHPDKGKEGNTTPPDQWARADVLGQRQAEGAVDVAVNRIWGPGLWSQQFGALFRKRALSVRRDRLAWASQLLLPAMFVLIALIIAKILSKSDVQPPLLLSTSMLNGVLSSGSRTTSLQGNEMFWADYRQDNLSSQLTTALLKAKSPNDKLTTLSPGAAVGAFLFNNSRSIRDSYSSANLGGTPGPTGYAKYTWWFRNEAVHLQPALVSLWTQMQLQLLGYGDSSVKVWNHPLPMSPDMLLSSQTATNQIFTDITVAITVILAMGFIPASFVVFLVGEKSSSGKHQQLISGVSPAMYWATSYLWDMVNFLVPLVIIFILFGIFQVAAYSGTNTGAVFFLLIFYGACMTPCMYCVEPIFTVPSTAYVTLICVNIFTGTLSVLATTVLDLYQGDIPDLVPLNLFCKAIFPWLLPNYCLGRGMLDVATAHYYNLAYTQYGICARSDGPCYVDPLSYKVAGRFLLSLILMTPVWLALRLLIEWGFLARGLRKRAQEAMITSEPEEEPADEAVGAEERRVAALMAGAAAGASQDSLLITNLKKTFFRSCLTTCKQNEPPFRAVRGLSVGVPPGECFGLLGVNGAGKTTTMRMITGDTEVSSGDIFVASHSVHTNRDKARQHLGYCPQFDALPDKLTVRETLALYARIRGIPFHEVWNTVDVMVARMCLEAHQNNLCQYLSGGNKRKLSTALALIGEPDVVLLDEPSTGVDVGARRFLWDVIGDVRKSGHAVVLTSHSMEECEVLCTRLTIMVHGRFRCLGTPTQLKARYGGGYTLTIKAQVGEKNWGNSEALGQEAAAAAAFEEIDPLTRIKRFVGENVPGAVLTEENVGLFRFRLGAGAGASASAEEEEVPLGAIFRVLEDAVSPSGALGGCVSDYALSQTSLEEVFLHFSQEAEAEAPLVAGPFPIVLPAPRTVEPQVLGRSAAVDDSTLQAAAAANASDDEGQSKIAI